MNRIANAFTEKAFIGFITAGDPDLAATEHFVLKMAEAGCDLIELGIPFSDPVAEGKVIQQANLRALKNDVSLNRIFETVERIRRKSQIPIVFLTYANPVYRYGYEAFCKACASCGVDGVIIPDLPYEEQGELAPFAERDGVAIISLVAPTSKSRAEMIARSAQGFLYLVSSMGVTGVRDTITTDLAPIVQTIRRANPSIPVAVGFGISNEEQAERIASVADGVIVGSAIVKIVAQYGAEAGDAIADYVKRMKAATLRAK